jgi:hypothetical protein
VRVQGNGPRASRLKANYGRHGSREECVSGYLPPTAILGKLLRHPRNLVIVELILSPILFIAEIHFPPILFHNQVYLKVCPNPLNLPSTGKPLCRNIVVILLFSVFPD